VLQAPGYWDELARDFGLGPVTGDPEYVARGAMGEIWRLRTAAGSWAVKWQFPWVPTEFRPADLMVQRTAAGAGIPLPLPVTTPDGDAVLRVRDRHARVYPWVELGPEITAPVPPACASEAGRLLGLLHRLAITPGEPVDPWYTDVPDRGQWVSLAARARSSGAPWAAGLDAARELIAELTGRVAPPAGEPIVCHRDFNPGNVLPAAADGCLVVLDWENSGPLLASSELGYAVFTWSYGSGRFDPATADALLAGYAATSGLATPADADLCSTAIATHLNFLDVMAEQWLTEPAHRGYAGQQIDVLLAHDLGDLARFAGLRSPA
jgi:Ser/Thr protein kinase RdoA (MazF antagonist)